MPALIAVISFVALLLTCRRKLQSSIQLPVDVKSNPIREAEDTIISDTLKNAGLSWGGLSRSKYVSDHDRYSWKIPILPSQRRKDITVLLLCIIMASQITAKIGYVALLEKSTYYQQGFSWSVVLFTVWVKHFHRCFTVSRTSLILS